MGDATEESRLKLTQNVKNTPKPLQQMEPHPLKQDVTDLNYVPAVWCSYDKGKYSPAWQTIPTLIANLTADPGPPASAWAINTLCRMSLTHRQDGTLSTACKAPGACWYCSPPQTPMQELLLVLSDASLIALMGGSASPFYIKNMSSPSHRDSGITWLVALAVKKRLDFLLNPEAFLLLAASEISQRGTG